MRNFPQKVAIVAATVALGLAAFTGSALAADPAAPPGCNAAEQPGCYVHPNAGRGNGQEPNGVFKDVDPGNSAGHNNGGG